MSEPVTTPEFDWQFRCVKCDHTEDATHAIWQCPACGGELTIDGLNDGAASHADSGLGLWEWDALLPATRPAARTILGEGNTPLVPVEIDGITIHLKMDSQLPTGSFKDRGAAVLGRYLSQIGQRRIIVDSSGNAAASMSAYAGALGLDCTVYVPASASPGKLVQARSGGATVIPVDGSRDDVARAAQVAAEEDESASYASHNWHPVFVEGVKTWALEVQYALGDRLPDAVYIPTGGGSAFVGAWRGFSAGNAPLPPLIACQPAACAPVARAWSSGGPISPVEQGATIAEGTRIAMPSRPLQIQQAIRESNGRCAEVSDDELKSTLRLLWSRGIYVEPTAALGVAACRLDIAAGRIQNDDLIVIHVTGHGLKSTDLNQAIVENR